MRMVQPRCLMNHGMNFKMTENQIETSHIQLPEELDVIAAEQLTVELLNERGSALTVKADQVCRVTTPCVQVLVSGAATWRADDQPFEVIDASPEMIEAMEALGLSIEDLSSKGADH